MTEQSPEPTTRPSGFEAWASGPVHPGVWLAYAKFNHPQWEDGNPVLVGDTLTEGSAAWVVLDVRLEQRGIAEAPSIRLGNPLEGPEDDDMILYAESPVGTGDPCVVSVPQGLERGPRFTGP